MDTGKLFLESMQALIKECEEKEMRLKEIKTKALQKIWEYEDQMKSYQQKTS